MIEPFVYTPKEMDTLYGEVEHAAQNHTHIDMFKLSRIVRPGDFYLVGDGANGLHFTFAGLKWVYEGEIYICLIQPQVTRDVLPKWYPVITVNDRDHSSWGRMHMIRKEYRYCKIIDPGWAREDITE